VFGERENWERAQIVTSYVFHGESLEKLDYEATVLVIFHDE
jgi:hypothetical protein